MSTTEDAPWIRLASATEIAEDATLRVEHDGVPVCLARSGGQLHAIIDRCTHQDVPLSEGEVEDGAVECFMHGSRFDLATGRVLGPPATEDVRVFPLRVDGDDVYVAIPPHLGD